MHCLDTAKGSDIEAKVEGAKRQVSIPISTSWEILRNVGLHHDENKHPVKVLQSLSWRQAIVRPMVAGLLYCHVDKIGTELF